MLLRDERVGGVCAATLTPLDDRYEPDCAAVVAHCRRLLASGCDSINLLGTTGEATSISVAGRLRVMEAVAASDLPVARFLVGTGAAAFDDALALTRAAVELGFAGALVIPPFYFKDLSDDGVFAYYERLIARVGDGLRLYLYHFPQLSGFGFSPALVARLTAAFPDTIAGLKDSSGVPGYAESIVAAAPRIDVFPSSESRLSAARASGFAGCISATLNVSAPLAQRVWRDANDDAAGALAAIRGAIAAHALVPAIRAVVATLLHDDRWRRPLPPLVELPPAAAAQLVAALDALPGFAELRAAYA